MIERRDADDDGAAADDRSSQQRWRIKAIKVCYLKGVRRGVLHYQIRRSNASIVPGRGELMLFKEKMCKQKEVLIAVNYNLSIILLMVPLACGGRN